MTEPSTPPTSPSPLLDGEPARRRRIAPDAAVSVAKAALMVGAPLTAVAAWDVLGSLAGFLGPCGDSERVARLPAAALFGLGTVALSVLAGVAWCGNAAWRGAMFGMVPSALVAAAGIWVRPEEPEVRYVGVFVVGVVSVVAGVVAVRGDGRGRERDA